jgi:spore maturation protein CgeB
MKVLIAHGFAPGAAFGQEWHEAWVARLCLSGSDVRTESSRLPVRGGRASWPVLDSMWRRGARPLLEMYEALARSLEGCDVLLNYGGVNLHPEFLRQLSTINVLGFFDDPESSVEYSRHVAAAHDVCMVGNVAELDRYRAWGAANVHWWPLGFRADDVDGSVTRDQILEGERDVPLALLCERMTDWRRDRVDRIARTFPEGVYRGKGWPNGFLPEAERLPLLRRTRIGINIHNSTGPINFRTFYLPANGVMQVCDNRAHLGMVFELDREVVGFETVDEAIDLVRYYNTHEEERRRIAAAGWERAMRDYNERACFQRLIDAAIAVRPSVPPAPLTVIAYLATQRSRTRIRRAAAALLTPITAPVRGGYNLNRRIRARLRLLWANLRMRAATAARVPESSAE